MPFDKNQMAASMAKGPHSTPLAVGDKVITVGGNAIVPAWNTQTGALAWRKDYSSSAEGRAADQAAILLTPANVLLLTTAGELIVAKRSPASYEEERRYSLADSATWAVPAVMKDALIVRDASAVMKLIPQ